MGGNGEIKFFDVTDLKIATFIFEGETHEDGVHDITLTQNGLYFVIACEDGCVEAYMYPSGDNHKILMEFDVPAVSVSCDPCKDSCILAAASTLSKNKNKKIKQNINKTYVCIGKALFV